jgi:hypothetical protein
MGHRAKSITRAQKYTTVFSKLAISFIGDCDDKKCKYINSNKQGLYHSSFKALVSEEKNLVPRSGL